MTEPDTPMGADAGPPPPVVSGSPEEVADGVFVIPDGRVPLVPNVGVVVGDRAALVVDTGMGPSNGVVVREAARELAGDRPLFLTLTHFHPEHGYGAQAFAGAATIIYNREQHDEFLQKAGPYTEMFRSLGDAVAGQLEGVEFVDPHVLYEGAVDLDLGGKVAQLRTWGTTHTQGDQTIYLPEERVLFTGDLVENRFFPILPYFPPLDAEVDGEKWIGVLGELERLGPTIVIPGHGEVSDAGVIADTSEYLTLLQTETRRLAGEGSDADAIVAELEPRLRELHPNWDNPAMIPPGVHAFLAK